VKVENAFEVPDRRAAVWALLMDVPRVVPCVPGATLTASQSEDRWRAELAVTLGPVAMSFDADITRESADEAAGLVALAVRALEQKGRGAATATARSHVEDAGGATRVTVSTDLRLQGAVARVGRQEIVEEVSQQITDAFARCLQAMLTARSDDDPPAAGARAPAAFRISVRAILAGLWRRLTRRER